MRIYSVAFFGHRYVDNIIKVENLLEEQIRRLIDKNEYVDFLWDAMETLINVYLRLYFVYEKIIGTITAPLYWCCPILPQSTLITKITFTTIIPM